jgi:hypothetical protein
MEIWLDFDAQGQLAIAPSPTSAQTDFDFYHGSWNIKNQKLNDRLSNCTDWTEFSATQQCRPVLLGIGNIDHFQANFDGNPFEGMTLRLFNPKTRLWNIYWADSNNGTMDPPVVGSFEGNIGQFFTKDTFRGIEIIVVFRWDKTDPDNPIWSQAFSVDGGENWEWNWYMYMSKIQNMS